MTKKFFQFMEDGLSLDETKTSLIMVVFFISSIYALFHIHLFGDIPNNFLFYLNGLLAGIVGINIAHDWKETKIKEAEYKRDVEG